MRTESTAVLASRQNLASDDGTLQKLEVVEEGAIEGNNSCIELKDNRKIEVRYVL